MRLERASGLARSRPAGFTGRIPTSTVQTRSQSLCLASTFVRRLLENFVAKGGKVLHPEDRTEVTLSALFGGGCVKRRDGARLRQAGGPSLPSRPVRNEATVSPPSW